MAVSSSGFSGEYGVYVFHCFLVLLHFQQSFRTHQTGFDEVVFQSDGFRQMSDGHDFVILSFAGFSEQEVCDCISSSMAIALPAASSIAL